MVLVSTCAGRWRRDLREKSAEAQLAVEPCNQVAQSSEYITPWMFVIVWIFTDPVVYFALGIDILTEESLHEHGTGGLVDIHSGSSIVAKREKLVYECPPIFTGPTKLIRGIDSQSVEDFNVSSLTLFALNRFYLLAGGVAVILEAGRVVGIPGGALFDYPFRKFPCGLVRSDELSKDEETVARVNLRHDADGAMPAEVPPAVDKLARVVAEGSRVERGGELGEDPCALANVEV